MTRWIGHWQGQATLYGVPFSLVRTDQSDTICQVTATFRWEDRNQKSVVVTQFHHQNVIEKIITVKFPHQESPHIILKGQFFKHED